MQGYDDEFRDDIRKILKTVKSIRGYFVFFLLILILQMFFTCGDYIFNLV